VRVLNDIATLKVELASKRLRITGLECTLDELARAADTAELMLERDYPAEAASLRAKVSAARRLLELRG
jgi:aminoglycoside phosphotransferase family enzyme